MEVIRTYLELLPEELRYLFLFFYLLSSAFGFNVGVVDFALLGSGLLCRCDFLSYQYTLPVALLATAMGETLIFLVGSSLKTTVLRMPIVKKYAAQAELSDRLARLRQGSMLRKVLLIRCMPSMKAVTLLAASGVLLDHKSFFTCYLPVSLCCSLLVLSVPLLVSM